jgi:hypothetical protein
VSPIRKRVFLYLFAVAILVLSILVLVHNSSPDDELLGAAVLVAGLAVLVQSLPSTGNGK